MNRPVLRYHGAKWNIAKWVVKHIPQTSTYLEPFFGSGAILFNRAPSELEHVCEIDGRVTNFFQVLRKRPDELIRQLELTPYSREELIRAQEPSDDPLESARRLFVASWQGIGALTTTSSWRMITNPATYGTPPSNSWTFNHLYAAAARLKNVQIDNRDCFNVIPKFNREDVTIYADPPYLMETRRAPNKRYKHELKGDVEKHAQLLELLKAHTGPVILSGYASKLYADMLCGWDVQMIVASVNSSSNKKAAECLWMNESAQDAMHSQPKLFLEVQHEAN